MRYRTSVCAFLGVMALPALASAADFDVTASSFTDYTINGQPDPTLRLTRGRTYTFDVNASGHPFYIKTAPSTGTGDQYTDGVTGNSVQVGTLTFAVPSNAPSSLFYICSLHGGMTGSIQIVNPVPAANAPALSLLAIALGAAGFIALRRHPRTSLQRL
jgi:hypothetical protein